MKPFTILMAVVLTFASATVLQSQEKSVIAKHEIQAFELGRAQATEVVKILNEQFLDAITFSANRATNVIYGRVPEDALPEVRRFIDELEQMAAHRHEEQALRADEERKQRLKAMSAVEANRAIHAATSRQQPAAKLRLKSFRLKHVRARDVLEAIGELGFNDGKLAVTMEAGSNAIVVRGDDDSLALVVDLIEILDVPATNKPGEDADLQRIDAASHQLVTLEAELQQLLQHFAPNHPKVQVVRQKIQATAEFLKLTEQLRTQGDDLPRDAPLSISAYETAERKAATFAAQWRKENEKAEPSPEKLNQLEAAVKEQVQLAFEFRQRIKRIDLERAAIQLEEIRMRLERREKIADEIIASRVEDLISGDDLTWLARAAAHSRPDGEVGVEVLENDIIVIKGAKQDVQKVIKSIQTIERSGTKTMRISGSVVSVDPDEETVMLSIGSDDDVKVGDALTVSRDGVVIGQLQIVSVTPDQSKARIESVKDGTTIGAGHEVRILDKRGDPETPATRP